MFVASFHLERIPVTMDPSPELRFICEYGLPDDVTASYTVPQSRHATGSAEVTGLKFTEHQVQNCGLKKTVQHQIIAGSKNLTILESWIKRRQKSVKKRPLLHETETKGTNKALGNQAKHQNLTHVPG